MNERENFASEREGTKRKIKTKNTKSHRERREKFESNGALSDCLRGNVNIIHSKLNIFDYIIKSVQCYKIIKYISKLYHADTYLYFLHTFV